MCDYMGYALIVLPNSKTAFVFWFCSEYIFYFEQLSIFSSMLSFLLLIILPYCVFLTIFDIIFKGTLDIIQLIPEYCNNVH